MVAGFYYPQQLSSGHDLDGSRGASSRAAAYQSGSKTMSDYIEGLNQDWEDLLAEIGELIQKNPELTAVEISEITGADCEDVLWAMAKVK